MEAEARKGTSEDGTQLVLKTEKGARGEGSNGPLKAEKCKGKAFPSSPEGMQPG